VFDFIIHVENVVYLLALAFSSIRYTNTN